MPVRTGVSSLKHFNNGSEDEQSSAPEVYNRLHIWARSMFIGLLTAGVCTVAFNLDRVGGHHYLPESAFHGTKYYNHLEACADSTAVIAFKKTGQTSNSNSIKAMNGMYDEFKRRLCIVPYCPGGSYCYQKDEDCLQTLEDYRKVECVNWLNPK